MPADQNTLDGSSKRRRGRLRREAQETTAVRTYEVDDELDNDEDEAPVKGITERKGRATPGRRTQEIEATQSEGNFITRTVRGLREYFQGVRSELQKVVWPTREETRRLTTIVLTVTIASAIVLGIISLLFNELFTLGLRSPLVFGVVFVLILGGFVYYLRTNNRRTPSY
ncbi:MAG: preprotein translocase subunit SecE [Chloroflexi bacterium]|nr:preprotein translocase subunit SecE [Chloroflexota bacterium]